MDSILVDVEGIRHAAVVGGGNTALDGVRELLTLGVEGVTLLPREPDLSGSSRK